MQIDKDGDRGRVDLGAQYISQGINSNGDNSDVYYFLKGQGALKLLHDNHVISGMKPEHLQGKHFVSPRGTSSIVSSLLGNAKVCTNSTLKSLRLDNGTRKMLATKESGEEGEFDAVIVTTTPSRALSALAHSPVILPSTVRVSLGSVTFSSRFELCVDYTVGHVLLYAPTFF
jgi:predicted NAD/FAD-dependent oxidoreductase